MLSFIAFYAVHVAVVAASHFGLVKTVMGCVPVMPAGC